MRENSPIRAEKVSDKHPAIQRRGNSVTRKTLSWVIDRCFTPYSSVGDTIAIETLSKKTGRISLRPFSFMKMLARAVHVYLTGFPSIETKRVGRRAVVCDSDAPQIPPNRGGGECFKVTSGGGNRSTFYPCCSHMNSLTKESVVTQRCWSSRMIRKPTKTLQAQLIGNTFT